MYACVSIFCIKLAIGVLSSKFFSFTNIYFVYINNFSQGNSKVSKQFCYSGTKSERRQVILILMKTLYNVCTVPTLTVRCRSCHLIYIVVTNVLSCHLYSVQCCHLYSIQKLNKKISNSGVKSEVRQVILNLRKPLLDVCNGPTLRIRCRCCHLIYTSVITVTCAAIYIQSHVLPSIFT